MDRADQIRDYIRDHKKIVVIVFVLFIAIIVFIIAFIVTHGFYVSQGGEATEEIDPLSGQTIYHIDQEEENDGKDIATPAIVGFDSFMKFGYTTIQYEILSTKVREFFHNNYKDITRISYVVDSVKYDDNEVSVLYSELVDNNGNRYKMMTNTNNTVTDLVIIITDSSNKEIFNSAI